MTYTTSQHRTKITTPAPRPIVPDVAGRYAHVSDRVRELLSEQAELLARLRQLDATDLGLPTLDPDNDTAPGVSYIPPSEPPSAPPADEPESGAELPDPSRWPNARRSLVLWRQEELGRQVDGDWLDPEPDFVPAPPSGRVDYSASIAVGLGPRPAPRSVR